MRNDVHHKVISLGTAVAYVCVLSVVSWSGEYHELFPASELCDDYATPDVTSQELHSWTREYPRSPSRLSAQAGNTQVYYVDAASPGGDGSSWQRAFRTLQEALSRAWSGSEIRVAQGVYKPGAYGGRSATFQLKNGVAIKGGYAARNAVDPDARDTEAFPTILSGDLSGNDGPGFTNNYDNCLHVVTGSGTNETAVLDGCTITGGNANGYWPDDSGAGMINEDGGSPTVTNCVFLGNSASNEGGAMLNHTRSCPVVSNCVFQENNANWGGGMSNSHDCSPIVSYCTFKGNVAIENSGGGLYNQTSSSPTVNDCTFTGNSAGWGGGMANIENSNPIITNCTFSENSALEHGGGGLYNQTGSNPTVTDCTFAGNSAGWGGGMGSSGNCSATVSDCTFASNSASENVGGGMCNQESSPIVSRCTFMNNAARWGGGMGSRFNSSPTVSKCTFANNSAAISGGGIGLYDSEGTPTVTGCLFIGNAATSFGGGLQSSIEGSGVVIANCVFSGNSAEEGGGMRNYAGKPTLLNCTFSENRADTSGGAISMAAEASPELTNCIFWGNTGGGDRGESAQIGGGAPTVNYCCIERLSGALGGMGNIGLDPLFRDADGADDIPGTQDDDLALAAGSPCIDAGDNLAVPANVTSDANGMTRFFDDPGTADTGNGTPPIVDMGAFEFQGGSAAVVDTGILYVDQDASGDEGGTSWEHAFRSLQAVLAVAAPGSEIRVAQGIYRPDEDTTSPLGTGDRGATFQLKTGVTVKGGYAGADAPDPDARDTRQYLTVLSGDLDDDDGPDFSQCEENSYHVVTADGTDATAVLDGFIIAGGHANGLEGDSHGAGVYNSDGCAMLVDCTFRANQAVNNGGGMYNQGDVTLLGCTFRGNSAMFGGGLYSRLSEPRLINCAYLDNTALIEGAGVYDDSGNPELVNCVFCANTTSGRGGGMLSTGTTSPFLINCTFYGNSAEFDGEAVWASSYLTLVNCIVWDDSSSAAGQVVGSEVAVMYSDIQGSEWAGAHNIHLDPLFVDPDGPDEVLGTEDDNLRLQSGSPCIDTGRNAWIPDDILTDLDGKERVSNGVVDMGVYESSGP